MNSAIKLIVGIIVVLAGLYWYAADFVGSAIITATVTDNSGQGNSSGSDSYTLNVVNPPVTAITVTAFTATPTSGFDPSPTGDNETLAIAYTLSVAPDSVTIEIKDANNKVIKDGVVDEAEFQTYLKSQRMPVEVGSFIAMDAKVIDKDGNGTITEQEMTAFYELADGDDNDKLDLTEQIEMQNVLTQVFIDPAKVKDQNQLHT